MCDGKYKLLKQWFSVTWYLDKTTELVIFLTNNHYLQGWMEERGYWGFQNVLTKIDFDDLLVCLERVYDSSDDEFHEYFPEKYIRKCGLWNFEKPEYRRYCRDQMNKMFDKLQEVQEKFDNGITGVMTYNIYYEH